MIFKKYWFGYRLPILNSTVVADNGLQFFPIFNIGSSSIFFLEDAEDDGDNDGQNR